MVVREVCEDAKRACVCACKAIWHSCVNLRYAQSWADSAADTPGHCEMTHSKSYKVNDENWSPRPRKDGGAGENLAMAYVWCCVWMLCVGMQFGCLAETLYCGQVRSQANSRILDEGLVFR